MRRASAPALGWEERRGYSGRAGRGPGAGRCSAGLDGPGARPAGSVGEAGPGPGVGAPGARAHLQRRAWKRLAREGAPGASSPPGGRPLGLARAPRPWHGCGRRAASGRLASRNGPRAAGNPRRGPGTTPRLPSPARGALARWRLSPGPRGLRPRGQRRSRGHNQGYRDIPCPAKDPHSRVSRTAGPGQRPGKLAILAAAHTPAWVWSSEISPPPSPSRSPAPTPARTGLSRSRCAARCR